MKTKPEIIIGGILLVAMVVIMVFLVGANYLLPSGCTTCGTSWTSIGRLTSVYSGTIMDIGGVVSSYNTKIQAQNQGVAYLSEYEGCQFALGKVYYYKQLNNGNYYINMQQGGNGYVSQVGSGDIIYTCSAGGRLKLDPTPVSCASTTNPDPTSYSDYQVCNGLAGVEIYLPSSAIQKNLCTTGQTRTKTCADGSTIVTQNCINGQFKATKAQCPSTSDGTGASTGTDNQSLTCTNSCPLGYNRGSYPDCSCTPTSQPTYVCNVGETKVDDCGDGSQVTTYTCSAGQFTPTGLVCPSTSGSSNMQGNDTLIWIGFIFFVLLIVVAGIAYVVGLVFKKGRR